MVKLKNTIAVLLAVIFVVSMTAAAVSARDSWRDYRDKDFRHWKEDGRYWYDGHDWKGHYDNYGNFWHKHGHYNGHGKNRHWNNHWHRFHHEHGYEKYNRYH